MHLSKRKTLAHTSSNIDTPHDKIRFDDIVTVFIIWKFFHRLSQNKNITYQQLLNGVREILAAKYSQKPQLSS